MQLSVIIPVFNEGNHVGAVIENVLSVKLPHFVSSMEIVVVDDCSTDDTSNSLAALSAKYTTGFKTIRHEINRGKGAAVRTGIENSAGDVILIQDADFELVPQDFPLLLETMNSLNIECVNGSRYMPGIIRPLYSYRRYYLNKLFTRLASILINVRLTDLACGYKLFTRNIYNQVTLNENRFGFEAELLIKIALLKRTLIAEVPVHYFPRNVGEGKKIRNADGFRIFWVILKYGLFRMN